MCWNVGLSTRSCLTQAIRFCSFSTSPLLVSQVREEQAHFPRVSLGSVRPGSEPRGVQYPWWGGLGAERSCVPAEGRAVVRPGGGREQVVVFFYSYCLLLLKRNTQNRSVVFGDKPWFVVISVHTLSVYSFVGVIGPMQCLFAPLTLLLETVP